MPGEGGMVLCDDPDLAERSRVLWQDRSSNWIEVQVPSHEHLWTICASFATCRCQQLRNLCFDPKKRRFVHEAKSCGIGRYCKHMEAPAPELWLFQELGWNYRMTNLQAWPESLE